MNKEQLTGAFAAVAQAMAQNMDYLTQLDAQFGDGDLGISMRNGFAALHKSLAATAEADLGLLLLSGAQALNGAAPSTLGTILSFWLMGMAKPLKGRPEADFPAVAGAMETGARFMMQKAGAKPGEKTIVDAALPGALACVEQAEAGAARALAAAAEAARAGAERTKALAAKHGRAAYYGEKSLGHMDGGAAAGALLFEALRDYAEACCGRNYHTN